MKQEVAASQYNSKIEHLKQNIQARKDELINTESEVQTVKEEAIEFSNKLQQNCDTILHLKQKVLYYLGFFTFIIQVCFKKFSTKSTTNVKLETSGHWVGIWTGADVTAILV